LHPNARARLRNEITLLPNYNGVCLTDDLTLVTSHDENSEQVRRGTEQGANDTQRGEEIRARQHDFMHGGVVTPIEADSRLDLQSQSALDHAMPATIGGRAGSALSSV
jgi:hypothetical protein